MITTTSSCLYLALPISEDCARQQQLFADRKRERNTRIFSHLEALQIAIESLKLKALSTALWETAAMR